MRRRRLMPTISFLIQLQDIITWYWWLLNRFTTRILADRMRFVKILLDQMDSLPSSSSSSTLLIKFNEIEISAFVMYILRLVECKHTTFNRSDTTWQLTKSNQRSEFIQMNFKILFHLSVIIHMSISSRCLKFWKVYLAEE